MDFVVAVKTEPKRVAKETAKNRITILLSSSEEVANPDIVHRDKAYLSKLQGTCFKCSKLNANPPVDVCENCSVPIPAPGCTDYENPCTCFTCVSTPPSRSCACSSTTGYPAVNTAGLGSGYWIGLQANNFYSNPLNGGWMVAVGCETGHIIGAFPVSNAHFGYGKGSISGTPVMVYPAGAVYGAGYHAANATSFPLLGLTTNDGNEIIDGSFTILTSGTPGCPTSSPTLFCSAGTGTVISINPKKCLSKYGTSECPEFTDFEEQPDALLSSYYMNAAGIENFDYDASGAVFLFKKSNGKKYCSASSFTRQPSDALAGVCGGTVWQDEAIESYADCPTCAKNTPVSCQFLVNLTNGQFNNTYGGYNSASPISNGTYAGIGPAYPPSITDDGAGNSIVQDADFWENWWGWDETKYAPTVTFKDGSSAIAFVPPTMDLLNNCACSNESAPTDGYTFIEKFHSCCSGSTIIGSYGGSIGITPMKSFAPGLGCTSGCKTPCINQNCSCDKPDNGLARPGTYGYIPCYEDCTGEPDTILRNTSILWYYDVESGLGMISAKNPIVDNSLSAPGPDNSCSNAFRLNDPQCNSICSNVFEKNDLNQWTFNQENFLACTGYDDINDPCFKSKYLPQDILDCNLELAEEPYDVRYLLSHVKCTDTDTTLAEMLCGCSPTDTDCLNNCYLKNTAGPFSTTNCNPELGALYGACATPYMGTDTFYLDCNQSDTVEGNKLKFTEIVNNKCFEMVGNKPRLIDSSSSNYANITDPCSCCNRSANEEQGTVECSSGALIQNGTCSAECQGSGCSSDTPLPPSSVIISNQNCSTGG